MKLQGRTAIVTGAGQGLGRAISLELAREGAHVVLADIVPENSAETAELIRAMSGPEPLEITTDVSDEGAVRRMVEGAVERFGGVDILVNNSGIAGPHCFVYEVSNEDWDRTLLINLTGAFWASKYVVPEMKRRGGGAIVNMSSVAAKRPLHNRTPYITSKMALIGLTRGMAQELGEFGIRVNAVCPGSVDSPRGYYVLERAAKQSGKTLEELVEAKKAQTPLRSFIPPEAVGRVVAFLCSDDAAMMTGQDINVSAGSFMS